MPLHMKAACFTGCRPKDLTRKEDQIKSRLEVLFKQADVSFVSSIATGADLYAAYTACINTLMQATVDIFGPIAKTELILDAQTMLERNRQTFNRETRPCVISWRNGWNRSMIDCSDAVLSVWTRKTKG